MTNTYHRITRAQIARIEQLEADTKEQLPTSWRGYSKDNAALLFRQLEDMREPNSRGVVPKTEQISLL